MKELTKIISYTANETPMKLDIMSGGYWKGTVKLDVIKGVEYGYKELKKIVCLLRPHLKGKDFELLPCEKPLFRNSK